MDILTTDFETYYDKDYSLSKMQTDAYIHDNRFEVIGVSVIRNNEPAVWFSGTEEETLHWLWGNYDWENSAVRCHNTLFDGFILTQRFGIRPKLWMDTLSQARMMLPYLPSHSLASLAKVYNLADKGTEVVQAMGKRRADFTTEQLAAYADYCEHDAWLCKEIGGQFDPFTPTLASMLIDMTVRMFTQPVLVGDASLMRKLYNDELDRKSALLMAAATDRDTIMSNDKFAASLLSLGVSPPLKVSKATKKETFAFAKTDSEFTDLLEHPDADVQTLVAARLGVKTTIAETRALKFLETSQRGPMPVYLNFWGAKTTGRYSGGNSANYQNIPARGPSSVLRKALLAPPGHTVIVGDSSNIELRTVMALAGQGDVLDKLHSGVDLYCDFASNLFGRVVTKADVPERFLGKTAMLGLQYGAGAPRFVEMVRLAKRTVPELELVSQDRAYAIVDLYRNIHSKVASLWSRCDKIVLPDIANEGGSLLNVDVNGWFITQWDGFGRPGEPGVMYHDLTHSDDEWTYKMGRQRVNIYGAKVVENLSQHAAMLIVMWQTARVNKRYPVVLSVHDEVVIVVPDAEVPAAKAYMQECLSMTPPWCRSIPVACDIGTGKSYGESK